MDDMYRNSDFVRYSSMDSNIASIDSFVAVEFYHDALYILDKMKTSTSRPIRKRDENNKLDVIINEIIDKFNNNIDVSQDIEDAIKLINYISTIHSKVKLKAFLSKIDNTIDKANDYEAIKLYVLKKLGISYETFNLFLLKFRNSKEFYDENKPFIDQLSDLMSIPSKDKFIELFSKIDTQQINDLIFDYKIYCERSLFNTKSTKEFEVIDDKDGIIVRKSPLDFSMLISVVKNQRTMGNIDINLSKYLEEFDTYNNPSKQSFQSLSFVSNKYLGLFAQADEDRQFIFGYQGYEPGFLTGSCPYDNWAGMIDHIIEQMEELTHDADSIINESFSIYNEITSYRRNECTMDTLRPTCVIALEKVDDNARLAAKKFGIDIVIIDRDEIYSERIKEIESELSKSNSLEDKINIAKNLEKLINGLSSYWRSSDERKEKYKYVTCLADKLGEDIYHGFKERLSAIKNNTEDTLGHAVSKYTEFKKAIDMINYLNYSLRETARYTGGSSFEIFDQKKYERRINGDDEESIFMMDNSTKIVQDEYEECIENIRNIIKEKISSCTLTDAREILKLYASLDDNMKFELSDCLKYAYDLKDKYSDEVLDYIEKGYEVKEKNNAFIITKDNKFIDILGNNITVKKNIFTGTSKYTIGTFSFKVKKDNTMLLDEELESIEIESFRHTEKESYMDELRAMHAYVDNAFVSSTIDSLRIKQTTSEEVLETNKHI